MVVVPSGVRSGRLERKLSERGVIELHDIDTVPRYRTATVRERLPPGTATRWDFCLFSRCYGTWLHGEQRGSIDRGHNRPGEPLLEPNPELRRYRIRQLRLRAVTLDERALPAKGR